MGLREIFERACLADERDMEARAAAEARLDQARAAGYLAVEHHFEAYRTTVETASTTEILGQVAMVHPEKLAETADRLYRESDALLHGSGIDPEPFSSERSNEG
jgi:hypothetical protein